MATAGTTGPRADDDAVRSVLVEIARCSDGGELADYGELLTDDCVIESPAGTAQGRQAILDEARARREGGTVGPASGARHLIAVDELAVTDEGATARSTFAFVGFGGGAARLLVTGTYDDELISTPAGHWCLARRRVAFG